ncbi:MAG: hypothetical protein IIB04_05490 [Acidobacteria bacterium]|nr:hypothetical protein [Acidobacteriota bacterium]MCH8986051.1 hypothetical protein [Acidobacteriota bacterium]
MAGSAKELTPHHLMFAYIGLGMHIAAGVFIAISILVAMGVLVAWTLALTFR